MASFHFSAQIISRAKGRSAIAAAAYRSGTRLRDETTGVDFDYSRRRGVAHTEILLPEGAAPWLADRQRLWQHAHDIEVRKDAQLARECNFALPAELSGDERLELAREFVREQFVSRGMVADMAIHDPTDNDLRNFHCHVMLTLRKATPSGLYRVKTREWNSDSLMKDWREAWATTQNCYLARGQHTARVDHRSLNAQREDAVRRKDRAAAAALDRAPEIHVGTRAQHAGRRPGAPGSQVRQRSAARPQGGVWRSSPQPEKRRREVDYRRIDKGTRPAYNADRASAQAARISSLISHIERRNARLRLLEIRYERRIRDAEFGLRELFGSSQGSAWRRIDPTWLAGRQHIFEMKRNQARQRSQLLRRLLGRTEGILASLFTDHTRSLKRSAVLRSRLDMIGRRPDRSRVSGRSGGRDTLF